MAKLEIKVGASVDRNLQVAYKPLIEGAKRAAAAIDAENKKAARSIEREHKRAATENSKAYAKAAKEIEKWQQESRRSAEKAKKDEVSAFEKAEKDKTRAAEREEKNRVKAARDAVRARKEAEREAAKQARDQETRMEQAKRRSFMHGANQELLPLGLTRTGRAMTGIGRAGIGLAASIAGGLARSQGVDLDLTSLMTKNASLETLATNVSNSGYMAGDPRNGKRVAARELMNDALDVGTRTGTDANTIMEGLGKFVGLTGDLKTGREMMESLAMLAKATGSEFDDMAAAAGNVSMNLDNTPDKAKRVEAVMRVIAGQGKMGAVEIKDMATQMAKIASQAGQFEGPVEDTIATLGAMAQESRAHGASASATQAATSVASFVSMLKTPKRAEKFEAATGTKVFNPATGMLRDPRNIIKEALTKVGMDPIKLKEIFANVQGARAMEGFATIYRRAGGGKAGLDAVDAEFERLRNAAVSEAEIRESFARAMKSGPSQAEAFNQQMRKTALQMQDALLPALVALAPAVVSATQKFADVTMKLFGPNQVDKNITDTNDKAHSVLDSAVKQVRGGKISTATADELQKSEYDTKSALALAKSDYNEAQRNKTGAVGRALLKGMDWIPALQGINLLGGGSVGEGLGNAYLDHENTDLQQKAWNVSDTQRTFDEVSQANRDLKEMLAQGIVVKIDQASIDALKKDGPPGVGGAGRGPSPEEKADQ